MDLTQEEISEYISGWFIHDCAIRNSESFSFLLLKYSEDAQSGEIKVFNYFPNNPQGGRTGGQEFEGFRFSKIGASQQPLNQAIVVSLDCDVGILGAGFRGVEKPIPDGKPTTCLYTGCFGLKTIAGDLYATGAWRSVCRRIAPNQWENIVDRNSMPPSPRLDYGGTNGGFDDLDGFSENDIYCAGGAGDVWRYDGKRWHQCNVPTNMEMGTVCCAGDGYVYIGMQMGSVMRGRENQWEIIYKGDMSLPFKDMVWYDGKVWCTSDYGLWVIENGKLREVNEYGPEVYARSGNLAVGDGVMLLAGMRGAILFDGKKWSTIL